MEIKNVKLAIVGSRTFDDYKLAENIIHHISLEYGYDYTEIVSGGARGADAIGERYADNNGIAKKIIPADWNRYGKRAGFIRNVDIIDSCDICICFWDGESHGTKHDIDLCVKKHKPCFIYNFVECKMIYNENI